MSALSVASWTKRVQDTPMSRFQIGEKVLVRAMTARHSNNEATVVAVEISKHRRPGVTSLDKYIVRFSKGKRAEFYDIHLARVQRSRHEVSRKATKESA